MSMVANGAHQRRVFKTILVSAKNVHISCPLYKFWYEFDNICIDIRGDQHQV